MATKSQRRKEKQKKKRKQKKDQLRKRQAGSQYEQAVVQQQFDKVSGSNARHRQRLAQQIPQPWPEEMAEDVAVFDDSALEALTPELANQVLAVRDALQLACNLRGENAINGTSGIPRSSPLSDWRLFIRGFVAWLANDYDEARHTWQRLNPQRRPGRIATAMLNALRTDLENVTVAATKRNSGDAAGTDSDPLDDQLLYHAKLLRKVHFDRAALKIAVAGTRMPEEFKKLHLGLQKTLWLKRFVAEYRETEPELTAALEQVALARASAQPFVDVFEEASKVFAGPRHDPRNLLLSFFYYLHFESGHTKADPYLDRYLNKDLPQNEALTEPLRAAIASQIHLQEAREEIQPPGQGIMAMMYGEEEDAAVIRRHLKAAMKAYPANRAAYKTYIDWIDAKLDNDRLTKPKRKPLETEKARVMTAWSEGLPDDVQPRLWLVDYLLENEQTDQAKPHVDWMAAARQDDPRIRATPWKWQLLEAMRLCRRKTWLKEVPAHLEQAAQLWPTWLSQQWLPYLKAAVTLRAGKIEEFETERQQICQDTEVKRDCLADACLMMAAAQQMRVPAKELKPLRVPVDQAVKDLSRLPDEELLAVSGFFWDLHRTQLLYPAYRMHGGKIVDEMFARFKKKPQSVLQHLDDQQVHSAILLCSQHRCLDDGYNLTLPDWYHDKAVGGHPIFTAAKLHAVLAVRRSWRVEAHESLGSQLRAAAPSQSDAYYRYWFAALADDLDDLIASNSSGSKRFGFNPFGNMFGDDDDDDELDFDPNCNCASCTAARRAYEAAKK